MYYSAIEVASINNGEGIRCVLWESGCTHRCKNCQNKKTWDKEYGKKFGEKELNFILNYLSNDLVDGITFSGGDSLAPFNIKDTLEIVKIIRDKFKNKRDIWVYTGYTFEEVKQLKYGKEILDNVDTIVDGRYVDELRDLTLEFRGSSNQNIWKKINNVWVNTTE